MSDAIKACDALIACDFGFCNDFAFEVYLGLSEDFDAQSVEYNSIV